MALTEPCAWWLSVVESLSGGSEAFPDGGGEIRWLRRSGELVHLWCGDEVGIVPLLRIGVGLLIGQGCGTGGWWC